MSRKYEETQKIIEKSLGSTKVIIKSTKGIELSAKDKVQLVLELLSLQGPK